MKPTQILATALIGALIGGATGFGIKYFGAEDPAKEADATVTLAQLETVPDFDYPDIEGRLRSASEWRDDILVLNFWAAWCPPCREETPLFVELQEEYAQEHVRFVGIAIDDLEPVKEFAESYEIQYPILIGDLAAVDLSKRLGNRFEGLPFTIVADPGGKVVLRHQGGIERDQLEAVLQAAIKRSHRNFGSPERI